jgi:hypothetical protein
VTPRPTRANRAWRRWLLAGRYQTVVPAATGTDL